MLKTTITQRLDNFTSKEYVVDLMRVKGYSIKNAIVYSDFITLQFHCGNELLFNRYSKTIDVTKGNFTKNIKVEDLEELYNQLKETLEVAKMAKPEVEAEPVSYTHLTLPTTCNLCRSRWSPYH